MGKSVDVVIPAHIRVPLLIHGDAAAAIATRATAPKKGGVDEPTPGMHLGDKGVSTEEIIFWV